MAFRRRIFDYGIALLLLLIPVLVLRANLMEESARHGLDKVVLRVTAPLQGLVNWTIDGVFGVWHRYVYLVDVEEENEELRREIARLQSRQFLLERRAREAGALEELVALRQKVEADTVGARVVASPLSPYYRVARMTLDSGDSVARGMPVVAARGLVGRVLRVYGDHADVLFTSDAQSSVDIKVARTGDRGVLTGLSREDGYAAKIQYLVRGSDIRDGDLIVTSGLGGMFPPGIPVGTVSAVKAGHVGLYREVEVTPTVDLNSLEYVLVIVAPAPVPDPNANKDTAPRPEHRVEPY
jgi:rod shape-determining protein MreC